MWILAERLAVNRNNKFVLLDANCDCEAASRLDWVAEVAAFRQVLFAFLESPSALGVERVPDDLIAFTEPHRDV